MIVNKFAETRTTLSLMVSIMYSLLYFITPYLFRSFTISFQSLSFPRKYYNGSNPSLGRLMNWDIKSPVNGTFVPSHKYPLWKHANKFFTHAVTFEDHIQCNMWIIDNTSHRCNLNSFYTVSLMIGPRSPCALSSLVSLVYSKNSRIL